MTAEARTVLELVMAMGLMAKAGGLMLGKVRMSMEGNASHIVDHETLVDASTRNLLKGDQLCVNEPGIDRSPIISSSGLITYALAKSCAHSSKYFQASLT